MLELASDARGRWLDTAIGKVPKGRIRWLAPARTGLQTYVGVVDGQQVARVSGNPFHPGWNAQLTGWVWDPKTDADSPAATMGIDESPVIRFRLRSQAQKAVQAALDSAP